MNTIKEEAIRRSEGWWYCDNVVSHKGQIGLLRMDFPRVFILIRDSSELMCDFEHFCNNVAEVNFLPHTDREDANIEEILIDAWNFLSLEEEEEENLYELNNGYDIDLC